MVTPVDVVHTSCSFSIVRDTRSGREEKILEELAHFHTTFFDIATDSLNSEKMF